VSGGSLTHLLPDNFVIHSIFKMPVITLTTDWGTNDFYVAALKGEIVSLIPDVRLIDITHHIRKFDLLRAAFIFRNSYYYYPPGTIHLIGVGHKGSREESAGWLVIEDRENFIVCRNDGFFYLVADRQPEKAFYVSQSEKLSVGDERSFLVTILHELSEGKSPATFGPPLTAIKERKSFEPVRDDKMIKGSVVYIDDYGNVITNIDRELFERTVQNRRFEIELPRRDVVLQNISQRYDDVGNGQMLALFNSSGLLEIAQNQGDAAGLYGFSYGTQIRINIL